MANDLLQTVQQNLGYLPLRKVKASNWESVFDDNKSEEELSNQAVLPAVLTALCKYCLTEKGAEAILRANLSTDWASFIFGDHKDEVMKTIAEFSHHITADIIKKIRVVTEESIHVIRKRVPVNGSIKQVRKVLTDSLDEVLLYLPIHMEIVELKGNSRGDHPRNMEEPACSLTDIKGRSFLKIGIDENTPAR